MATVEPMLCFSVAALVAACLPLLQSAAFAQDMRAGAIEIIEPWSRATPGGAEVAAGYVTLKNTGDTPDRLVSASAEIAESTEIHEMSMANGVMRMRPLPEGVPVPAGAEVALKPGGSHLMLFGLKRPLRQGESFAGTLTFEHAGSVNVTFKVEGAGASAPSSSEHQGR